MPILAPVPVLDTGEELVGDGERVATFGFAQVKVYRLAFYVNAAGLREALQSFAGRQLQDLCADAAFYQTLITGCFSKAFEFTFLRSLSADRCRTAFMDALLKRTSEESIPAVQELIAAIPAVLDGSRIVVRFDADGKGVALVAEGGNSASIVSKECWIAFQDVYFGQCSEVPCIKLGAVQRIPQLLAGDITGTGEGLGPSDSEVWHLRVRLVSANNLGTPEYRVGDLTSNLLIGSHRAVYVKLILGSSTYRTATTEGKNLSFLDEPLQEFTYNNEDCLQIQVFEQHGVKAIFRGDALIGQGSFSLHQEAAPFLWNFMPLQTHRVDVSLTRCGKTAGLVSFDCELVPPPTYLKNLVPETPSTSAGEKQCTVM